GATYKSSYCNDYGNGVWNCQCSNNYVYQQYQLSGVDQTSACTTVMDLCDSGVIPEFEGEPVCMPTNQSSDTNYCSSQETCTLEAELGNGITAVQQTSKVLN